MSLLGIFRYLTGYLDISISGDCTEQFINLCTKNNISVWHVRKEFGLLKIRMSVKDYKNIRNLKKELKVKLKIKILKKHGIRFKIHKYRKRKGIFVGLVIFFAFLIFMSNFIWTIEIKGNKTIENEKIISVCKELGVYEGVLKKNVDAYNLPLELILKLDGIAWCSFNIEGSNLTVEISESKESKKESKLAANLVAKRDGVIEKLEITDGVKMVKVGQAVRKGDILASGVVDNGVRIYTVNATGKVTAKTERIFRFKIKRECSFPTFTGITKSRSVINFFGINLPLYLGNIKYKSVNRLYEKKISMFGQTLPISLTTKTFEEIIEETRFLDQNEAKNIALELLANETKKLELFSVEIEDIASKLKNDEYVFDVMIYCREDISEKSEINIQNELKNNH